MEYEVISSQAMAAIYIMLGFGLFVPLIAAIVWTKVKKDKFTTVLLGAAGFAAFAIVLEAIPKALIFNTSNSLGRYVMSHNWTYIIIGALLAGLFEETARFFVYKVMIKSRKNKETAVSYGLGHGGLEIMYLFLSGGVTYLLYAILINSGSFGDVVAQTAALDANAAEELKMVASSIAGFKPSDMMVSIWERISAMMVHIGCSIIVFKGARENGKLWMYPLAILLHTAVDCIAGMYQTGYITDVYVCEAIIFAASLMVFAFAVFTYIKMPASYDLDEDEKEEKRLEDIKKLGM